MKLGYTIIYVPDVAKTIAFYEAAFGLTRRFLHESGGYGELDTGETTLAFASNEAADMAGLAIQPNTAAGPPAGWEVCLISENVAADYEKATAKGAIPVSPPTDKPWGQTVSYVRDLNGCIVEIASPVIPPS